MTAETNAETLLEVTGEPHEIKDIGAKLPLVPEETELETEASDLKRPRESKAFNHGTGKVTFVQALKLITASRATLSRYTNDGKLSFETDENGHKIYQVAELERVFGKLKAPETDEEVSENEPSNHEEPAKPDHETVLKLALLEQENQFLRERLEAEAEKAKREAQNAADWKLQAERVTLMLTHRPEPTPIPEAQPEASEQPKRKFLGIFGGGR